MQLKEFLKDKLLSISLLLFATITIEILLAIYPIANLIKIYILVVILGLYGIGIMIEYFTKKKFYEKIVNTLNELDEKYLITELMKYPSFIEGKILKEILEQIDKSMLENVNQYKYLMEDYKEYIELWIHEIKLPIAASKLIIENNKNLATKSINEELDKVENYIEQALFYARSNTVEKDYYIKKSLLKDMVNECIKKNKNILIQEKISINLHDLEVTVNTDSKWIVFILNQFIQNSVKYKKNKGNSEIELYAKQGKENVILYVRDNGVGIKKGEITRVFEKGFTGTNGRKLNKKSTGIGLYLCKKLCDKLGISLELNSIQEEGTEIRLVFPQSSYINF
ncbi:MAG: HAMP domain-containing histidine kinase [Clostridia bacterium]|nr:HAMP domain-containing histidine kinase [Clostridia bacterium]